MIILTDHSIEQAKVRFKWNKDSLERMATKAFEEGILHKDTKGQLNRYINKLYLKYEVCNNIRIYGEVVYLFKNGLLITLYQIPNEFKKYLKK